MALKYDPNPTVSKTKGRTTMDVMFDVGRAFAQGLSFGTADEIEAFVRSKFTDGGLSYDDELKNIRADMKKYSEAHPYTSLALEVIGSIPTALAGGAALARTGLSAAKIAGLEAGVYGAGAAEGDASDRLKSAAIAAPVGMLGGKVAEKMTPLALAKAQSLLKKGYDLTPGQKYGGAVKALEEGISLPFVQDIIKGQQQVVRQQFNRKTVEDAISGLKDAELPKSLTGESLVERASEIVSDNYEAILPKLSINTAPLKSRADSIIRARLDAQALSEADIKELTMELNDVVYRHAKDNVLSKQILKDVESELGKSAFEATNRRIGRTLKEIQSALRDEISKQNPDVPDLQIVNDAFRKMKPIEAAKNAAVGSGGEFTPTQLLRQKEYKRMLPTMAEKIAAREARDIISSGTGSSGTAERLLRSSPLKTALGAAAAIPASFLYGGVGGAVGRKLPPLPGTLARTVTPFAASRSPDVLAGLLGPTEAQAAGLPRVDITESLPFQRRMGQ